MNRFRRAILAALTIILIAGCETIDLITPPAPGQPVPSILPVAGAIDRDALLGSTAVVVHKGDAP